MEKLYSRINWHNYPNVTTPLNETNLNKMDKAINDIDNRIVEDMATKNYVDTAISTAITDVLDTSY